MKKFAALCIAILLVSTFAASADARVLVRDRSVVKIGEDINMGSDLSLNDLVTFKANINVKGNVAGDVVAVLGNVILFPTARVNGDVVSIGGSVTRQEGSVVRGQITEIAIGKGAMDLANVSPYVSMAAAGGYLAFKVMILLGFMGLAAIMVSFLTRQLGTISSKIENQWLNCLLWGVLGILLIVPIAVLLAVTIIGIPLIAIEILLLSIAMTMGYVSISQLIGKQFTKAVRKPNQPMLVEVIWGLLILFLIDLVPFIGPLIKTVAITIGFGGALITKMGF